mmetsp:Transcript_9090/g.24701  ORF Transcript_9090/g.24701 Transcript_9090/m.24701 type:complete len:532 (-) Transcript_9090:55-1650(-)
MIGEQIANLTAEQLGKAVNLVRACGRLDADMVEDLLCDLPNNFLLLEAGQQALRTIIAHNNASLLTRMLLHCPAAAATNNELEEPLSILAIRQRSLDALDVLCSFGVEVPQFALQELMMSVSYQMSEEDEAMVLALLKRGLSPVQGDWKTCPIVVATKTHCSTALFRYMLEHSDVDFSVPIDVHGSAHSLMMYACKIGNLAVVDVLLEKGLNVMRYAYYYLSAAVQSPAPVVAKRLVQSGIQPTVCSPTGVLALFHCRLGLYDDFFMHLIKEKGLTLMEKTAVQDGTVKKVSSIHLLSHLLSLDDARWARVIEAASMPPQKLVKIIKSDELYICAKLNMERNVPFYYYGLAFSLQCPIASSALLSTKSFKFDSRVVIDILKYLISKRRRLAHFCLEGHEWNTCTFLKDTHGLDVRKDLFIPLYRNVVDDMSGVAQREWLEGLVHLSGQELLNMDWGADGSLLMHCLQRADSHALKTVINLGADPNKKLSMSVHPLHWCVRVEGMIAHEPSMVDKVHDCLRVLLDPLSEKTR